jgi:hypothetical protein
MSERSKDFKDFPVAAEIKALVPHIHPPAVNPAPMALFAFGLTTALLQVKHTTLGNEDVDYYVFGFAAFFGGLLQVIGGLAEAKRNNIFGYTGFLVYGGFWMSWGASLFFIKLVDLPVSTQAVQAMLSLMGIFTFVMFVCSLVLNMTLSVLMWLLMMTFFLLAAGVKHETVDIVGGWFGMLTAATAYWLASAELLNASFGRDVVPLGKWKLFAAAEEPFKLEPRLTRSVSKVQPVETEAQPVDDPYTV